MKTYDKGEQTMSEELSMLDVMPESLDLDTLLGLAAKAEQEAGLSETVEEVTETKEVKKEKVETKQEESKYEDNISEPHISVTNVELSKALSLSKAIAQSGENSFESNVISLEVNGEYVTIKLTDNKRTVHKDIKLLNTNNKICGMVSFMTSTLDKLVKVCDNVVSIVEFNKDDKKTYAVRVHGGDVYLDNIKINAEKYKKVESTVKLVDHKKEAVQDAIKRLYTYAGQALRSGKVINFKDNEIIAMPHNSVGKIKVEDTFAAFKLNLIDSRILYTLLGEDSGKEVYINRQGNIFKGEQYTFETESYPVNDDFLDVIFSRMFSVDGVSVDLGHLRKLVELSCKLDSSTGNIRLFYTRAGRLIIRIMTKRGESDIVLDGLSNEKVTTYKSIVEVNGQTLKNVLSVFAGESSVVVKLSDDGVAFNTENVSVMAIGKVVEKVTE